jgi:hypothetical protein
MSESPRILHIHSDSGLIRTLNRMYTKEDKKESGLKSVEYSGDLIIPPETELIISGSLSGDFQNLLPQLQPGQTYVLHTANPFLSITKLPKGVNFFNKGVGIDATTDIETIIRSYREGKFQPWQK